MSISFLVYVLIALFGLLFGCAPTPATPTARQRQMVGLVQKFDRFDHDGDGYLTGREVMDGVREAGTLSLTPAELKQVMRCYDTDGDKRISHHEAQRGSDLGPVIFTTR